MACLPYAPSRVAVSAGIVCPRTVSRSALFINAQTQEVRFIRQSDRDQLGAQCRASSKSDCFKPLRTYANKSSAKHFGNESNMLVLFLLEFRADSVHTLDK